MTTMEMFNTWIIQVLSLDRWIAPIMLAFTFLGNEEFYLLIAPAIYWCWNDKLGLRLAVYLMLSTSLNNILKLMFHSPRPFWYNQMVHPSALETTFGFPSGHAQNSIVLWVPIARHLREKWAYMLTVILIIMIGISRIYLGVHFPSDVIGGWLIGSILLMLFVSAEGRFIRKFISYSLSVQISFLFGFSIFLILIAFWMHSFGSYWDPPAAWIENYALVTNGLELDPYHLDDSLTGIGLFFGLTIGAVWLQHRGGYTTKGTFLKRAVRYPIGLLGVIILWAGLGRIFPRNPDFISYSLRFLRYSLIGAWISALAPLLFLKLRLIDEEEE